MEGLFSEGMKEERTALLEEIDAPSLANADELFFLLVF